MVHELQRRIYVELRMLCQVYRQKYVYDFVEQRLVED